MSNIDAVLAHVDANLDAALDRLFQVIRIKSISTDHAYDAETRRNAEWHAADLASIGFDAAVRDTAGHPVVTAHDRSATGRSVLFYGHYDVQPVDPLNLWTNDPFDPKIVDTPDGKIITGRGAADDKGQLMTFVEACRAWKAVTGSLPLPISILLEGEEESGGASLPPFIDANLEELRADVALICDTDMWDRNTPRSPPPCAGCVVRKSPSTPPAATCIPACTAPPPRTPTACWPVFWLTCTMPMAG